MPNTSTKNGGHIPAVTSTRPVHNDVDTSGPVPMSHRNRLGHDILRDPNGVGMPSTESKINGGKKTW